MSDILSSTYNIRQLSARLGGADCTSHFLQFPVSNPCLAHLAPFQPYSKILKMFYEFIINRHLRPKQCLFQHKRHKQPVSHATTAFRATTFQPDGALVTLSREEAKFDSHGSVPLRVPQPPSTLSETGSPRPSDNLLL